MKVVVLGASGNAGTALLRALEAEPARRGGRRGGAPTARPTGLRRRRPGARSTSPRDPLEPVLRGADAVVHLAWLIQPARDLEQSRAVNVGGSRRVMAAVARRASPRSSTPRRSAPTRAAPRTASSTRRGRRAGCPRRSTRATRPRSSGCWTGSSSSIPTSASCACDPGLIFQRGAASEIRRLFAGPFLPSPLVAPRWIPIVPAQRTAALSGGPRRRRRRCLPPRHRRRRPRRVQRRRRAGPRRRGARPAPGRASRPGAGRGAARRRGGGVPPAAHADAAGLGGHGPRRPADGQLTRARGARMAAAARCRRRAARAAGGIRSSAGSPTPTLKPGGDGRLRAREFLTGLGARGPGSSR